MNFAPMRFGFACALSVVVAAMSNAQNRKDTIGSVPVLPHTRLEAGVKVMEHDKTAFARATQLELVGAPLTVAGGSNGDPEFDLTNAYGIALLSDGRIATLAGVGSKFFIFQANGKAQRTIGRQGKGPGEFMAPYNIVLLPGDTMFVSDPANARYNWVLADRGVVRSTALPPPTRETFGREVVGVFRDGKFLIRSSVASMDEKVDTAKRSTIMVSVIAANGIVNTIGKFPNYDQHAIETNYRNRRALQSAINGFTRQAHVAAWDTSIVVGVGDGYRINLYNRNGTEHSRFVVNVSRKAVTPAMRDDFLDKATRRFKSTAGEGMVDPKESERIVRITPFADSLPPYAFMFVSPNKTLWVVDGHSSIDGDWFATAFRTDGAILGRLHLKGKGIPIAFGDDRVVIRDEDRDGLVSLVVRRIGVEKAR